tara:strand:- start:9186 stop:11114 length:1929 start_codon:yes stop_codon:yes gene_type:complete
MSEGGGGFNQGYLGQGFHWWVGQVADDSYWRDNILSGKFESAESIPGWGYRYKVRIFGIHDLGETAIKSENLPWANVMYPVTAGAYLTNSGQTPMIRQGNIVFGFFLDGKEQQVPCIMGCMGNNSQTILATTIGDDRVTNTTSGESVCVSGYSEGNVDYQGSSKPVVPDGDKVVQKPSNKEVEKERAKVPPGVALNKYGLPSDRKPSAAQQKDINNALQYCDLQNLDRNSEECLSIVRKRVKSGKDSRVAEANSPRSDVQPGAAIESEAPMRQTAADLKRDKVYCEKRVLLKPDNIVVSSQKAMQTDMDTLVQNLDKSMNALQSYTDAVSMTEGLSQIEKMVAESSKRQSKYMKIVMDKMMEYTEKALNKEMTKAVSALPAMQRMNFLDVKNGISQNLLDSYNQMTNGNAGLMEGVISKLLNLDMIKDQFQRAAAGDITPDEEGKMKGMPRVPTCTSEKVVATVLAANKNRIEDTNNNLIDGIDGFLRDAMADMAGVSGSMQSMFSKLGNIKGSLTSALNFENIKMNVFPFEQPPNQAVSDYYTLCSGGASAPDSNLPSSKAVEQAANTTIKKATENKVEGGEDWFARNAPFKQPEIFAEPTKNTADIDLTLKGAVEVAFGSKKGVTQADIVDAIADEANFA